MNIQSVFYDYKFPNELWISGEFCQLIEFNANKKIRQENFKDLLAGKYRLSTKLTCKYIPTWRLLIVYGEENRCWFSENVDNPLLAIVRLHAILRACVKVNVNPFNWANILVETV